MYAFESPTHIGLVLIATYQKSDCRIVIRAFQQLVNSIYIVIQFPGILRVKRLGLQFHDYIGFQSNMIEQHVNPASTIAYYKFLLPAYKCKTGAEFKKKPGDILFKCSFKLFFLIIDRNRYKSEVIVVFSDFLRHTTLCFG